jgi:septum formation protein
MELYLASASPRRVELLRMAGLSFKAVPADVDEGALAGEDAETYVRRMALSKAQKIHAEVSPGDPQAIVLGADTIVTLDGARVLGKPVDASEAREMLGLLSGKAHRVFTAFAVIGPKSTKCGLVATLVSFRDLSAREIEDYVATGEPLDKAGAYAIQGGHGALLIDRVEGSYSNVIGLPLKEALALIQEVSKESWG